MYSSSLRIIFAGTPSFAAYHLAALIDTKHKVIGVLTQPDRPAGRGNILSSSPVKHLATLYNIPIFQPHSLNSIENFQLIKKLRADIIVVVAYSVIFPQEILNLPNLGCINVHGSLLPRWRGAAPIQRALLAGDKLTGITIIQMNAGLDTGNILYRSTCTINSNDTSASLHNKLAKIGSNSLLYTLNRLTVGEITPKIQDNSLATYANKIDKSEAQIDWSLSAIHIERCIRAFNPWPISYFLFDNRKIKVWAANVSTDTRKNKLCVPGTVLSSNKSGICVATGDGLLTLTQLQMAGRRIMSSGELLNSCKECFAPGVVLID